MQPSLPRSRGLNHRRRISLHLSPAARPPAAQRGVVRQAPSWRCQAQASGGSPMGVPIPADTDLPDTLLVGLTSHHLLLASPGVAAIFLGALLGTLGIVPGVAVAVGVLVVGTANRRRRGLQPRRPHLR